MTGILKAIGLTLLNMGLALLTGPMIKKMLMLLIEHFLERYEEKAKETPETSDDKVARDLRAFYEEAKKEWSKI